MARKQRELQDVDKAIIEKNAGNNQTRKAFALKLNYCIKKKKKSLSEMNSKLGISLSSLSNYRNGKVEPGITNLELIASYLGVSTDYLLGKTDSMDPDRDIRAIHHFTRISEKGLLALSTYSTDNENVFDLALLSLLIEKEDIFSLLHFIKDNIIDVAVSEIAYDKKSPAGLRHIEHSKLTAKYSFVTYMSGFYDKVVGYLSEGNETILAQLIKERIDSIGDITSELPAYAQRLKDFSMSTTPTM